MGWLVLVGPHCSDHGRNAAGQWAYFLSEEFCPVSIINLKGAWHLISFDMSLIQPSQLDCSRFGENSSGKGIKTMQSKCI